MKLIVTLIPLVPLLGFFVLGLGFRRIPKQVASLVAPGTILLSFTLSVVVFFSLLKQPGAHVIELFNWISVGKLSIPFSFLIDPLSSLMLLIVTGVGFLIHVYSIGYMYDDEGYNRFFAYMNLFVFSMLLLVMGSNYVIMFIGWEGVGLCSYLLIGFWFKNHEYNNAAKKAFIMNRIGDLGFILGIFLLFVTFESVDYAVVFSNAKLYPVGSGILVAITLLLFVGAVGKSAQIPLYTWLPDAMAGPTPVSALIHAATMVTAGVYMIARSNILYALSPLVMSIIGITALATLLLAGTIALLQNDIKKVLAYSTVSQLGYMFLGLSVGSFTGAMFHLTTHAFFKALLFLGAGSVIHAMGGEQDIRKMGGLRKAMPATYWTFLIATLAISGIPPLSGFFSKDEILMAVHGHNTILWAVAVGGAMITAFYMFRLFYLTFSGNSRASDEVKHHLHESPSVMTYPLMALAVLAAAGGFLNIPHIFHGSALLENFLAPVFKDGSAILASGHAAQSTVLELLFMAIPLILAIVMIYLAYRRYVGNQTVPDEAKVSGNPVLRTVSNKFYVDEIYHFLLERPGLWLSRSLHDAVEVRFIDKLVNGIGSLTIWTGSKFRYIQTGHVGFYLFIMVFGIIAILVFNILLF